MDDMAAPRRAAPENEEEIAADLKAWRRYSIWVIIGMVVAVIGIGIFGYLAWWSLCDSSLEGCRPGEAATYWGSAVAAAALGSIIGILAQIWLRRTWRLVLMFGLPALVAVLAVVFWFVV
ncbi:hypothetical protein [Acidipropionibacterium jensenii]|uniref:Uncharacterized protein n=1 Tax=Acidipropionibacterium jensenii TaxID=1749 RepID=A0A448P2C2_9ACTN|nr:hypothetical protein FEZ32_09440 [Acidipropionibacterium jensenii]VEI04362.1 Uncharacterised protein [Acidipropionibacterium jensenii]